jgi:hypothetical protein
MNIRVMGLPGEVRAAVAALTACPLVRVIEVHGPYANRGDDERVRMYVTALHRSTDNQEVAR